MSPISFFQRHPRGDLSAFLDGELSPPATLRLEAHVASCEACASRLEELRETRSALRAMPEAEAPRSFALTPEMARRDAAPTRPPRTQRVVYGLRLTSGALAVALAVVLLVDLSGGGGSSSSTTSNDLASVPQAIGSGEYGAAIPSATSLLSERDGGKSTNAPTPGTAQEDNVPDATSASGENNVGSADAPDAGGGSGGSIGGIGSSGSGGGVAVLPSTVAAPSGEPLVVPTPGATAYDSTGSEQDLHSPASDVPKAVSGGLGSATPVPEAAGSSSASGESGGADTLTIVAIVLGVLLAVALIGSIAASRLARNTP
jgi:hypothetical protein